MEGLAQLKDPIMYDFVTYENITGPTCACIVCGIDAPLAFKGQEAPFRVLQVHNCQTSAQVKRPAFVPIFWCEPFGYMMLAIGVFRGAQCSTHIIYWEMCCEDC